MGQKQIGWFHLKESKVFRNSFECAAWFEDVLVEPGKYPVIVHDYRVLSSEEKNFDRRIDGHCGGAYTRLPGTITADDFGSRFCGMPIGEYDGSKNVGKPGSHSMFAYLYQVASEILGDTDSPWELLPEYEAKEIRFESDGKEIVTHGIFLKEQKEGTEDVSD